MGASGTNKSPISSQLSAKSLGSLRKGGIRIIDSGYETLSSVKDSTTKDIISRKKEYALVLNRRNNYSIRERIISSNEDPATVEFRVVSTFKSDSQAARDAWEKQKKAFN